MVRRLPDGAGGFTTKRVHLQSLARRGDPSAIAALANIPEMPKHGDYLWARFRDLSATRQFGATGDPARLSRLEIQAWERDEQIDLEPWERRTIMAIDAAFIAATGPEAASAPTEEVVDG